MSLLKYLLTESTDTQEMVNFLKNKKYENPKSKRFLYHGTKVSPNEFQLTDDYDWEDSNVWSGDLPEGYLFMTTDIKEASTYGEYVIPCELHQYDNKYFKVETDNPSRAFDMDYGIDLYKPDVYIGMWQKFEESGKRSLVIRGNNKKWTVITDIDNIIPRVDLAVEYYNSKK